MNIKMLLLPIVLMACTEDFKEDNNAPEDTGTLEEEVEEVDPNTVDDDGDGFTEEGGDCDDFNNTINPDAEEIADNGVDEDCDGEDLTTSDADIDNDNDGFTENEGDCDDNNNTIHPGMTDVPDNGVDEDCDGIDATIIVEVLDVADAQVGDLIITEIMNNPSSVSDSDGEWFEIINLSQTDINLNGLELGDDDGVESIVDVDMVIESNEHLVFGLNADSATNGGIAVDFEYSSINLTNSDDSLVLSVNGSPLDRVAYDETFPTVAGKSMSLNPDQYNNSLNDNGTNWCYALSAMPSTDFGTPGAMNDDCSSIVIIDNDGDGYEESADCDDSDATINPGAVDIADDGIDQDCDGVDSVSSSTDIDGDGYTDVDDCDDNDASINPGMLDIGPDGIDNNCDGQIDENGLCSDNCSNAAWNGDGDCDDGGPNANFGLCGFGADCSDCGGRFDLDGDTYYDDEGVGPLTPSLEMDCNDNDAMINPGMLDIGLDGLDQDCDGADETGLCDDTCVDADDGYCDDGGPNAQYSICSFGSDCSDCAPRYDDDGDGYYDDEGVGPLDTALVMDCDDTDSGVNPGETEVANDGVDQDCDGADLVVSTVICDDSCSFSNDGVCDDGGFDSSFSACDLGTDCTDCGDRYDDDEDGFDSDQDCNDSDLAINPGVSSDVCDGVDNDCDGVIDQDFDTLEPNDSSNAYYLGDLDQVGDSVSATSYMTHENDEDAYSLYLFDNMGFFEEDSFFCGFTPPAGIDISVEVLFNGSSLGTSDLYGSGQTEAIQYNATWLIDDEGIYTFVVTNTNGVSSCDAVTVYCEK